MSPMWEIQAPSATRDAWTKYEWDGKPQLGPWTLPDGRDIIDEILEGRADTLPFPIWARIYQGTRIGDMLWTGGLGLIASTRLVTILEDLSTTGYATYPLDVRHRDGSPLPGFTGFRTTSDTPDTDVTRLDRSGRISFYTTDRIANALRTADLKLDITPVNA